jgi:hypothetical protein
MPKMPVILIKLNKNLATNHFDSYILLITFFNLIIMKPDKPSSMDELILIGNGIGMAIDHTRFSLKSGVENAKKRMTSEEIQALDFVISSDTIDLDNIESSVGLAYLNLISMLAYRFFYGSKNATTKSLLQSNELETIARSVNKYIYLIANSYNDVDVHECEILNNFFISLSSYLKVHKKANSKVHIATTNYDDLFYKFLLDDEFMLPDPNKTFFTDGFNRKNSSLQFDNEYSLDCSWYMHLHGSSRFYSKFNSNIVKKFPKDPEARRGLLFPEGNDEILRFVPHIILSYFDFKSFQIVTNGFLKSYLKRFEEILPKVRLLYIYGYAGKDEHINKILRNNLNKDVDVTVIDYFMSGNDEEFWQTAIGRKINFVRMKNILEYKFT